MDSVSARDRITRIVIHIILIIMSIIMIVPFLWMALTILATTIL